jgi:copper(I)-binding protein
MFRAPSLSPVAVFAVLATLCTGCGPSPEAPEGASAPEAPATGEGVTVADAIVNVMPGGEQAAVYLTVHNGTGAEDRLVAVQTEAAPVAEIHETVAEGDVLRMAAAEDGFPVAAGETLELAPGGKHIMLVGLLPEAATAESVALTLHFATAGEVAVTATVQNLTGADAGMDHSEMDHSGMDHSGMDHSGMDHSGMDPGEGSEEDEAPAGTSEEPKGIH